MKKILITEDQSAIANFLAINLQANGFLTSIAKNGYEAIEMIENQQFDLLLLDLNLPGKDGIEVIEQLRAKNQQIAIIILTAQDKVRDIEIENYDYILKTL